jgi:hypothetical protein
MIALSRILDQILKLVSKLIYAGRHESASGSRIEDVRPPPLHHGDAFPKVLGAGQRE